MESVAKTSLHIWVVPQLKICFKSQNIQNFACVGGKFHVQNIYGKLSLFSLSEKISIQIPFSLCHCNLYIHNNFTDLL